MKKFTIMIIPHRSGRGSMELNVGWLAISITSILVLLTMGIMGTTFYMSTKITSVMVKYSQLEKRNNEVLDSLGGFQKETDNLKTVIFGLKERDQEIRRLLGLKPNSSYFPVSLKKK
jgi:hypothetical protein